MIRLTWLTALRISTVLVLSEAVLVIVIVIDRPGLLGIAGLSATTVRSHVLIPPAVIPNYRSPDPKVPYQSCIAQHGMLSSVVATIEHEQRPVGLSRSRSTNEQEYERAGVRTSRSTNEQPEPGDAPKNTGGISPGFQQGTDV